MAEPLGIAIIGAGFIGGVHARCVADNPRTRLAAVYDIDIDAARRIGDEQGIEPAMSLEAAIEDAATDAIVIATPTATHGSVARAAIAAGKAFLCEKPLDTNFASALETTRQAKRTGVFAAMAFNRRFDRQHLVLKQAVDGGEVGRIEMMLITSRTQSPPPLDYVATSGGQLRDKGAHFFDIATWIAGERPATIYATGACLIDPRYAEHGDIDTAMIILEMESGALCHMNFSRRTAYGYDERIEVVGSAGMVQSRAPQPLDVALYQGATVRAEGLHQTWYPRISETYPAQLDAFVDALQGKGHLPGLVDGLVAETIAAAGMRSIEEGRPIRISYDFAQTLA